MSSVLAAIVLSATTALSSAVWPLQPAPEVVAPFRAPEQVWAAGHRGVDLLGWVGQPVHAAEEGTVVFAGRIAGRGVVAVAHGTRRTTYEPLDLAVHVGDPVVAGQVLGTLAWAGGHCPPRACLHWGLVEGKDGYRDPLTLFGCEPQPVRLLPLDVAPPAAPVCEPPVVTAGQRLVELVLRLAGVLAGRPGAAGRS